MRVAMSAHFEKKHNYKVASVNCWVVTVSNGRTEQTDTTGKFICERLKAHQHSVSSYTLIKNDTAQITEMANKLRNDSNVQAVIFHGGTGLSKKDQTARILRTLYDEEINGFGELFRMLSYQEIGAYALLSRASAGIINKKLVFSLPGSENAVQLAMDKLVIPAINHAVQQLQK